MMEYLSYIGALTCIGGAVWIVRELHWRWTRDPAGRCPGGGHFENNPRIVGPDDQIRDFFGKLAASQRPLNPEAARILNENAWDLYEKGETFSQLCERIRDEGVESYFEARRRK